MRVIFFAIAIALGFLGCSRSDPIDRLMASLQKVEFSSIPFSPIDLPTNTPPEKLIAALSNRGDFTNVTIIEIREVQDIFDTSRGRHHTAVLLNSNTGQKIVLFQWQSVGWEYEIHDAKTLELLPED